MYILRGNLGSDCNSIVLKGACRAYVKLRAGENHGGKVEVQSFVELVKKAVNFLEVELFKLITFSHLISY